MTALPRADCPICQRRVALRVDGQLREHRPVGVVELCEGSGYTVEMAERMANAKNGDLQTYTLTLCGPCRTGAGGECHVPGCAFWMNRAPDVPLRTDAAGLPIRVEVDPYLPPDAVLVAGGESRSADDHGPPQQEGKAYLRCQRCNATQPVSITAAFDGCQACGGDLVAIVEIVGAPPEPLERRVSAHGCVYWESRDDRSTVPRPTPWG